MLIIREKKGEMKKYSLFIIFCSLFFLFMIFIINIKILYNNDNKQIENRVHISLIVND